MKAAADELTQRQAQTPVVDTPVNHQGAKGASNNNRHRQRYFEDSQDNFMKAWAKVVYAEEQDVYQRAWGLLCTEFPIQTRKFARSMS
jgi:hypothetical protein